MTLTRQDLASPFSSPGAGATTTEGSARPHDDSAEGMRRLRDPFAVNSAPRPRPATADDEAEGHGR